MELHPLLSILDIKDFEQYMAACKEDLIEFLIDLGLNNDLAVQVLVDVGTVLLKNSETFLLSRPSSQYSIRYSTALLN